LEFPGSTSDSNVNYIDSAIVGNQLRIRFDTAFGNPRPDRAEFFYPKCGCFQIGGGDPDAPGPPLPETNVDHQELRIDVEYAITPRFSGFLETPVRFLNPEANENASGLGDLRAGFKFALIACPHQYLTLQFRTYIPTGDADRGLGTDHVSLEPGLLYYRALSDRLTIEAELRDWIPIEGGSGLGTVSPFERFAGNVLRYGIGASYTVIDQDCLRVAPVAEFVGWTILDGQSSEGATINEEADGDTIVNFKVGTRAVICDKHSFSVGYGTRLTGDHWYDDILRIEYRLTF
jgi:hypothetical protein